jgi:uncharacterized protein YdaU (DUF1376 family)
MLAPAHADDFLFGPASMSNELPYFPFYPTDFLLDENVEAMTHEQIGCYMVLICRSWVRSNPGYIPAEPDKQARLIKMPVERWEEIKAEVLACFQMGDNGELFQPRLLAEYTKAKASHEAKVKGGKTRAAAMHKTPKNKTSTRSPIGQLQDTYSMANKIAIGNRTEQNRTEQNKEDIAPVKTVALAESPLFDANAPGGPDTLPRRTPGLSGHADGQETKAATKPPRKPNPAWDAVCEVWGLKPDTKADATRIGKLARDYSAKGATVEEIKTRLDRCKRAWPNVTVVTPEALLKHWETFANEPTKTDSNISRVHSGRPIVLRNYVESPGFDPSKDGANGGSESDNGGD